MANNTYHERGRLVHGYPVMEHPLYRTWANMKGRCQNSKKREYPIYGGRSITVCERWQHFENFALDMGLKPSPNHSIERVDNDKGYCPENCVWADKTEQALNRRTFSNNTTGARGIILRKKTGRYVARYDVYGVRYKIGGTFETVEEAVAARNKLISLLDSGDIESAKAMCERPARYDSHTQVRGITKNQEGYVVRVTHNGERIYIGFSKTYEVALGMLEKWKKENV